MFTMYDWKNISTDDPGRVIQPTEPTINLSGSSPHTVLSVRASGIVYNRDAFPYDTTEQAARRVYDIIRPMHPFAVLDLNLELQPWKEFPKRHFKVTRAGVDHNFEVDTWHWWMLEYLTKIVKQKPS